MEPKYPGIKVKLVGTDGNAFAILGKVQEAMRKERVPAETILKFRNEAMSGNYDQLLQTCMKWVTVT